MKHEWTKISVAAALAVAVSVGPSAWAMGMSGGQEQEHRTPNSQMQQRDYSNNEFYKTGNREGYEDYQSHQQRKTHNHKYRNDEDRRAHDAGYQEGLQGHQYQSNTEHPH